MSEYQEERDKEFELLQRVERGEISADEASRLLEDWTGEPQEPEKSAEPEVIEERARVGVSAPDIDGDAFTARHFGKWLHWWVLPYAIGVILTVLGAVWLYFGYNGGNLTAGFWLAWIPFMLGVAVMALSWRARASHWIHVRVRQHPGRKPSVIAFSVPLPYRLIKWATRNFGHYFPPQIRGVDLDELIDTIEESVTSDNPVYIWVNDESDQEQVEIWIGPGSTV